MKFCVSTGVGTWTNWSTFEPDPENLKVKIWWRWSKRHLTQSRLQVTGWTAERYCLLHVVVQWPRSFPGRSPFLYDVRLPNFRILVFVGRICAPLSCPYSFVNKITRKRSQYSSYHETFATDMKWLWDDAVKFWDRLAKCYRPVVPPTQYWILLNWAKDVIYCTTACLYRWGIKILRFCTNKS